MKKYAFLLPILCLGIVISSCKKSGCTDPEANNYDGNLKSNNLLCTYEGQLMFWYDKTIKDSLIDNFTIDTLIYYVNNLEFSRLKLDNDKTKEPQCGGSKRIPTYDTLFGGAKLRTVKYRIESKSGMLLYHDFIEMKANECIKIKLD